MAAVDDLTTARDRIATRISEYALALADDTANPQPSYSLSDKSGSKSVSRNEWRQSIAATISALNKEVVQLNETINALSPYVVTTRMIC